MKLQELFEGRVKNAAIDRAFDKHTNKVTAEFAVMINGKLWTKGGIPVPFKDYSTALRAADKITASRNITTQVVPLKK